MPGILKYMHFQAAVMRVHKRVRGVGSILTLMAANAVHRLFHQHPPAVPAVQLDVERFTLAILSLFVLTAHKQSAINLANIRGVLLRGWLTSHSRQIW